MDDKTNDCQWYDLASEIKPRGSALCLRVASNRSAATKCHRLRNKNIFQYDSKPIKLQQINIGWSSSQ